MTGRIAADWPHIARRLARAGRIAVLTDFDGTLAPLRRRPHMVQPSGRVRRALAALAAGGHVVGVVSGRAIDDLRRRVGVKGLWYSGNHGFFLRSPGGTSLKLVRPVEHAAVARAARELLRRLRRVPGVWLEEKPASVAVHYRGAPPLSHRIVARVVRRVARRTPSLRLLAGKCVWELLPRTPVDKAAAVQVILDIERRRNGGHDLSAVFIGDDVTDEPVFGLRLMLSVVVGRRRSRAGYRLRSPGAVVKLLERLRQ
jgi:trehalose-phosphatase